MPNNRIRLLFLYCWFVSYFGFFSILFLLAEVGDLSVRSMEMDEDGKKDAVVACSDSGWLCFSFLKFDVKAAIDLIATRLFLWQSWNIGEARSQPTRGPTDLRTEIWHQTCLTLSWHESHASPCFVLGSEGSNGTFQEAALVPYAFCCRRLGNPPAQTSYPRHLIK